MIALWKKIRSKICPKRIYKYGNLGLKYFDDRTWLEKACDKVDFWADSYIERAERIRAMRLWHAQHFHSFFDVSTGGMITSVEQIKKIEKEKGLCFMSFREIEQEAKRYKKINEEDQRRTIKRDMGQIMRDVANGRKFTKEIKERIHSGHYDVGKQRAYNQ